MTFDDIKDRVIHDLEGKPCGFRRGARGFIGLAWLVDKFLHLPVEIIQIGDDPKTADHWLAFKAGQEIQLNREQLGAIWAYWRQCAKMSLGHWHEDGIYLPISTKGIIEGDQKPRILIFCDQGRAEMCKEMCWNVFGLHAELEYCKHFDGWAVNVTSKQDGNRRLTVQDEYRLEGACSLLASHTITPAPYALKSKRTEPEPESHIAPEPTVRPARQVVRSRRRSA